MAQYLDGYAHWAHDLAQARAELVASALPKISIADYALPTVGMQQAISKMAIPPDLGLFKTSQPASSWRPASPHPASPGTSFPPSATSASIRPSPGWSIPGTTDFSESTSSSPSAAALVAQHQDLIRSMASLASIRAAAACSLVDHAAMSATAGLVDLFRSWRETAETGLGLLRGLARAAHSRAALRARAAVLNGDDGPDGPVAWFIEAWLHMRVTPERIEAVSAALLEEGWDVGIPEDPAHLLTDLRKRTVRQARVLRPIWETQLNYRTIGRLDHTVTTSNGTLLTVADLVPDLQTTEDLVLANECEEQRLRRVLSLVKPDELQVTNVYAERSELTWAEAGRLAGAAGSGSHGRACTAQAQATRRRTEPTVDPDRRSVTPCTTSHLCPAWTVAPSRFRSRPWSLRSRAVRISGRGRS